MKFPFFICIVFLASISLAQESNMHVTVKATIVDQETEEVLPFATVYSKQLNTGTASNIDGYFELPGNNIGDTLVITYVGYEPYKLVVTTEVPTIIHLSSRSALLEEIVVVGESDFLYRLVANLKSNKNTKPKTSKVYFFLETMLFDEVIEIIECYYNGRYSDYGVDRLSMKKGRIGIKPVNNRYFRSTESSNLFTMHDIFDKHSYFPSNPLPFSKKELRKSYHLTSHKRYTDNLKDIIVVDFEPKNNNTELFSGRVWIDQKSNLIEKVILKIEDAAIHPFLPIGFNTIQKVDMDITKSYQVHDGEPYIHTVDFNYEVTYADSEGHIMKSSTRTFTTAYDYASSFTLPEFVFTPHYHEDYRNITAVPYDSVFWANTNEFRFYDRLEEVEAFIRKNKIKNQVIHPKSRKDSIHSQLQFPYIQWHEKRFKMNEVPESTITDSRRKSIFDIDRFNLNVKLYLDVNTVQDSLVYQTYTILDPVESFYHFSIDSIDLAFMNMYFDLMEIQKREFETDIYYMPQPSKELINDAYYYYLKEFVKMKKAFLLDTHRGKNKRGMMAWNQLIFESLGVDNLKYFNIEYPE